MKINSSVIIGIITVAIPVVISVWGVYKTVEAVNDITNTVQDTVSEEVSNGIEKIINDIFRYHEEDETPKQEEKESK